MQEQLPDDVVKYLIENPSEVERIRRTIVGNEELKAIQEKRRAQFATGRMVPCGVYGCTTPRNEYAIMCKDCYAEYKEDHDAFK